MNLTKNFESNKEQIIDKIENMFNFFDILTIDCDYHQTQLLDYYTVSVYTISNNTSGTYLNALHKKNVMNIDYSNNDDIANVDTDFIFYFYPDCIKLYMQCYLDSSVYNQIHLKTIYTTDIKTEIENLIK